MCFNVKKQWLKEEKLFFEEYLGAANKIALTKK